MNLKLMKKEAVDRMKLLGLPPFYLGQFEDHGELYIRQKSIMKNWLIRRLTKNEKKIVKKAEEEFNIIVYHVDRMETKLFGTLYTMLYVSDDEEEWEEDRNDLKSISSGEAYPFAYVWNAGTAKENEDMISGGFGEGGSVGIVKDDSWIKRTQ